MLSSLQTRHRSLFEPEGNPTFWFVWIFWNLDTSAAKQYATKTPMYQGDDQEETVGRKRKGDSSSKGSVNPSEDNSQIRFQKRVVEKKKRGGILSFIKRILFS